MGSYGFSMDHCLSTHGLSAGLAGISYREPLANLTVHETQKPPWSTGPPQSLKEWWTSHAVGYIVYMSVCWGEKKCNVSCTASVQLPGRPSSSAWAVERDITKYGTMWSRATTGWQTTPGVVSQAWHQSWRPNPVVTGTRPRRFSGDFWRRRIDKRDMCFCLCSCLYATLGAYHWICDLFLSHCQCHCSNRH